MEMSKRVNFSEFERQVLVACVRENAHIIEDKRTDKRTTREKDIAWERVTVKYNAKARVTNRSKKQLENCWKNLKSKYKSDRKEGFRSEGGPAAPDDTVTQAIGEILQKRFDPIQIVYNDISEHNTDEETPDFIIETASSGNPEPLSHLHDTITDEAPSESAGSLSPSQTHWNQLPVANPGPSGIRSEQRQANGQRSPVASVSHDNNDSSRSKGKTSKLSKQISCKQGVKEQILKYRRAEHEERMRTMRVERKYLTLEHRMKMELLELQIENEKSRSAVLAKSSRVPLSTDTFG